MSTIRVRNETRQTDLGSHVRVASTLLSRTVGLLATPALSDGEGLWISPCSAVHSFFMRYPIDILFLDANGIVLHASTLAPWRCSRWVSRSRGVLEIPVGTVEKSNTRVGDQVSMKDVN